MWLLKEFEKSVLILVYRTSVANRLVKETLLLIFSGYLTGTGDGEGDSFDSLIFEEQRKKDFILTGRF